MPRFSIIAAACAASFISSVAFAQASSPSRDQVKAETRAAQKSGDLTPAGGGEAPMAKPHTGSKMTKEQRKAETAEARKKGELAPAGGGSPKDSKPHTTSTKSRQHVKDETMEARKKGELAPAGGGPTPKQ